MKGTTMIGRLINPHFGIASAHRWMIVPLLVITLAFATLVTLQSGTASADTGSQTDCDTHTNLDCIETELGETPQTGPGTATEQVRTDADLSSDNGEDINTGNCFVAIPFPCW